MDVHWFFYWAIVAGISVSEMGDGGSLELSTLIMLGVCHCLVFPTATAHRTHLPP